jgi:hypothetical protein
MERTMTARFAGSRSVDERRRRRLATDAEDAPAASLADPVSADAPAAERISSADEARASALELAAASETWMPVKAWKAWLLFVGVVAVAAGTIVGGWFVDREPAFFGPELAALLGLHSGRLVHALGSLLLLLAAQLSLVVWWRRSRSTRDFEGRYDVWLWTAAGWLLFAVAHETRLHLVWSETVALVWEPDFWNKSILSWFAPAVGAGGVLWMAARADARRCRSGWWLLTLAGLCWVAAGAMVLGIGSIQLGPWRELATVATTLAGHVLGFGGMLLHARFVTHVCNDPPVVKARVKKEWPIREKRSQAKAGEANEPQSTPHGDANADFAAPTAKRPARSTRSAAKTTAPAAKSESKPAPAAKPTPTPKPEPVPAPKPADEPAAVLPMIDSEDYETEYDDDGNAYDGPPPEMLYGLSKRQKKKLRKEWRDRQRAARADAA